MDRRGLVLLAAGVWMVCAPAYAGTVQQLRGCVGKARAQLPGCIRDQGKENADPCKTGIMMEVFGCVEKFDARKLHLKDTVRRKILYDTCLQMHNEGTGQTAQEECDMTFPPIGK